ncbi:nitroreductase [Mangrovibacterium marinum]|uniref:Nitroreductase n=1 Tax=Mangrovibacterium marinum TaxID=1639118 RepID=A0A2T5C317_9BACT|nr:nitroreductase [Mangrovibacterium marinum]PTN09170.1 nitroreductase [Mangrovibacterium marinum]
MTSKAENIENWLKSRKSTFVNGLKEGSKIDDAIIGKLLENASWAPSHGLVQAWHFNVFAGDAVKRFFSVQQEIYKAITPADKFVDFKYDAYAQKHQRVSHIIAIVAKRDPYKRFPVQEDVVSVACAVENIYLSLQAYDIAGYLSTGGICYAQQMRDFLELEEEDVPIGFFILGEADESFQRPPRMRIPAAQKTKWIRE